MMQFQLCLRGLAPNCILAYFDTRASVPGRNTRNKNKSDIPAFNTDAGQRSFIYLAIKSWNTLPEEITKCENLHSFKSKAMSHFIKFIQFLSELTIIFFVLYLL